jgi:NAD(P)-dependent dehydrogenase (short-subunit alcohol dehydrogenase family)
MREKNNYNGLSGLKILITGATDGLGLEISIALAEAGADVIAVGRDKKKLEDLSDAADQTKGTVTLVCIDLAKQGTIEDLSRKISEKFGSLEIIIHCAMSSLQMMPINQVSLKEIETNLLSPIMISFRLISCFHQLLSRDPRGLFVYISDVRTKKFNGPYNSAKKACDQLFLSYQEENKRLGINVLIEYPGPMGTKLRKKMFPGEKSIDTDAIDKEARRIIEKILMLTKSERIIT